MDEIEALEYVAALLRDWGTFVVGTRETIISSTSDAAEKYDLIAKSLEVYRDELLNQNQTR